MQAIWFPFEKVNQILQVEGFIVASAMIIISWVFYSYFLSGISLKRHRSMRKRFRRVLMFYFIASLFSVFLWAIFYFHHDQINVLRALAYVSLIALFFTSLLTIQLAQIYVYLYLFWSNMSVGVPRLIANMFTFVFSICLYGWLASDLFGIQVTTVLATSAIFSLVLGLALQDTLGNLFSGVALQMDRPFQIGDWVEIQHGGEKWSGQILEMTWRATSLMTFSDELVLIPNKTIAQSQIFIFSGRNQPVRLNHLFRFDFSVDVENVKSILLQEALRIDNIMKDPAPRVLIIELTESWISVKLFYSIFDYSLRYRTADQLLHNTLMRLRENKMSFAHQKISVNSIGNIQLESLPLIDR